jgi:uncharacterized membrane protein
MYGLGYVLLAYAYQRIADLRLDAYASYLASFVASVVLLSVSECVLELWMEAAFRLRWLDYSQRKLNLGGRFCLSRSLYLGCLGVAAVELVHPALARALSGWYGGIRQDWLACASMGAVACFVADALASARLARNLSKTMKEWEAMAKALYRGLKEKQDEYERAFRGYEGRKQQKEQEWRRTVDAAKAELMRDPRTEGEAYRRTLAKANEDFRADLRQMKEDIVASANERDMAMMGFLEDVRRRIGGQLGTVRGRRKLMRYARLFKAYPDIAPATSAKRRRSRMAADAEMLTKDVSVVGQVWQEVKDSLVFLNSYLY